MCSSPQVKSPSITIYLPFTLFYLPPPPFPLVIITILSLVTMRFFCLIPSPFSLSCPATTLLSDSCQSVLFIYESVPILFVSLFCSLDSTFKWNHMVLVFLWLAYFTQHNTHEVYPYCHRRHDFLLFYGCVVLHCANEPQFFAVHFNIPELDASVLWIVLWAACNTLPVPSLILKF